MLYLIEPRFYPKLIKALEGETVSFNCITNRNITWTFNNGGISIYNSKQESFYGRHTLRLLRVGEENEGLYVCEDKKNVSLFKEEGILIVQGNYNLLSLTLKSYYIE